MDLLLEAARFATYTAALQLFGAAVFQQWLAPAGLRAALDARVRPLALASALLLPLAMLAWLAATAGTMGDGWASVLDANTLALVLSATSFGHVWLPLLIVAAATAGYTLLPRSGWLGLSLASAAMLIGLGLVGHAAMASGFDGILNRLSQVIHLLSSAFWLGSLFPLLLSLPFFRDPRYATDCDAMLRHFSGLGHLAVALLLLSGVTNTWFVMGGVPIDLGQPYQQLLLLKVGIAGIMVCLATINRYVFVPAIPDGGPGLSQLARGTIAEIALSAFVLALVSVIGTLSPG
ncbi:MAG: copper homeostasis membrane protein CopD [Devosia sp.]